MKHLKTLIQEKIEYSFLNKFIEEPEINEQKLYLLSMIIENSTLPKSKKNHYILTTMLVQIALDTHELVSNNDNDDADLTEKQLTVLAGDYFSGLYYLYLAEIEDINMIQLLASTIKEINEYKMQLYFKDAKTLEEHIKIMMKIDSLLVVEVAQYINSSLDGQLISNLLNTNILLDEKRYLYNNDDRSMIMKWLADSDQTVSAAIPVMKSIIQQNTDDIEDFLSSNNETNLNDSIRYILNEIIFSNTSVAEEG